jgi:hypothetical protein
MEGTKALIASSPSDWPEHICNMVGILILRKFRDDNTSVFCRNGKKVLHYFTARIFNIYVNFHPIGFYSLRTYSLYQHFGVR